jgi:hypothetical protein
MTDFHATVHQNQFLAVGADRVDALVRVTASASDTAVDTALRRSVILVVDVSGSMGMPQSKFTAAMAATSAAIDCIEDGVSFGIIAGSHEATVVFPKRAPLATADATTRREAKQALRRLRPGGGTAIGAWLRKAAEMFALVPDGVHQVILMTDGQNQSEQPAQLAAALEWCTGKFQCDCRGVGDDWEVDELRDVSSALLGSLDIIPDASDTHALTADFVGMMRSAMGKSVSDAVLRLWTPRHASVEFVKQVLPSIEDLSARRAPASELVGDYPTGAWGDETRDYHVRVQVPPRPVGDEMLAGRVQLMVGDEIVSEAKLVAIWTDEVALSTKIDAEVARAAGNSELAEQIKEGIRAWEAGDEVIATERIGRAVQLAYEAGDTARLDKLAEFAEIHDAPTGTVVVRRDADRLAAMTLDAQSSKTTITRTPVTAQPGVP